MTKDQQLIITILDNAVLEVRRTIRAFDDDGTFIGERHHRGTFIPGTAIADLPAGRIRQIANLLWTPEVVASYQASQGQNL